MTSVRQVPKAISSSSGLLKQEIVFRSGTKKKKCFSFRGGKKKMKFGLIRIIYKAFFWAEEKTGGNQKKLKHFIVASSQWTVLFLIYVDLTFNRKVKQIFESNCLFSSEFLQEKKMSLLQVKWRFCSITCLAKALKTSVIYRASCCGSYIWMQQKA